MSEQKRITVEEVKAAYELTGFKPERHLYVDLIERCACGIGVVAIAGGVVADSAVIDRFGTDTYGCEYVCDFIKGFDGEEWDGKTGHEMDGYKDGQACAAAVFNEQGAPSCPSK